MMQSDKKTRAGATNVKAVPGVSAPRRAGDERSDGRQGVPRVMLLTHRKFAPGAHRNGVTIFRSVPAVSPACEHSTHRAGIPVIKQVSTSRHALKPPAPGSRMDFAAGNRESIRETSDAARRGPAADSGRIATRRKKE
jgi:hypothetical protein